jgi:hypothetical protein
MNEPRFLLLLPFPPLLRRLTPIVVFSPYYQLHGQIGELFSFQRQFLNENMDDEEENLQFIGTHYHALLHETLTVLNSSQVHFR